MSKFKTDHYYLFNTGEIIKMIDDSYNLPFVRVQMLGNIATAKVNQNILERMIIKDLGPNELAVRVLLGNKE